MKLLVQIDTLNLIVPLDVIAQLTDVLAVAQVVVPKQYFDVSKGVFLADSDKQLHRITFMRSDLCDLSNKE